MALLALTTDVPVHDPVIVKEGGTYYCFSTHGQFYASPDLRTWKYAGKVFERLPAWTRQAVPALRGEDFWAPELVLRDGLWRLYYAVSTFGKNTSAIGMAVNKTLDPASPDYAWQDCGAVVTSAAGDRYNAIDPAVCADSSGQDWLLFGSFWGGLVLVPLDADGLLAHGAEPRFVASRATDANPAPDPNPIEGGFIYPHGGRYYLFASHDFCCRGTASSYHIVVGAADAITGPYRDAAGVLLLSGGGTTLRDGLSFARWAGPGHNSVFQDDDGTVYLIYHAYDRTDEGRSKLLIDKVIGWDADGWPVL